MKQQDMIATIHDQLDGEVTKSHVRQVLACAAALVTKTISKGGECVVPGIGVVKLTTRRGRSGVLHVGAAAGTKFKTKDKVAPRMVFYKNVREAAAKNKPAKKV